ncbi:MAG: YfhO family protein [Cytophagaceae bacterium]
MPYLIILLLPFLAFLQFTFSHGIMKWDTMEQFLPMRYYIGECLQAYHLPLWNPYHYMGTPLFADPQSTVWYPLTWFWGYFFGYNFTTMNYDFLLHITLAGVGLFKLTRHYNIPQTAACYVAISYMLSGFFLGNAQHMSWIASGTWIPFVILYFNKSTEEGGILNMLKFSFFMFLFISGGYPGFLFIIFYFLTITFLGKIITHLYDRNTALAGKTFLNGFLSLGIILITCSVLLYSFYYGGNFVTRGDNLSLSKVLVNPFSPGCYISFFYPLFVAKETASFGTDFSMNNAYAGIIFPALALFLFFRKPQKHEIKYLILVVISILAALGDHSFMREFMYNHLPFMDLFRHPALFRLFIILGLLIPAAYSLEKIIHSRIHKNIFSYILYFLLLLTTSVVVYGFAKGGNIETGLLLADFNDIFHKYSSYDSLIIQSFIHIISICSFLLILKALPGKAYLLIPVICFDMTFSALLNQNITVAEKRNVKELNQKLGQLPKGFPIPENKSYSPERNNPYAIPVTDNASFYYKELFHMGYNPFIGRNYNTLTRSCLADSIFSCNVAFFGKDLVSSAYCIEQAEEYQRFIFPETDKNIHFTGISPNSFSLSYNSEEDGYIVILQNYDESWKAYINNIEVPVERVNFATMAIPVTNQTGEINLIFKPNMVYYLLYLSVFMFLLLVVYQIKNYINRNRSKY